jgi:chromate transporter
MSEASHEHVSLAAIARGWTRIGCTGFGGPPAHIALLRGLYVERRAWLSSSEFEDGIAAVNLLPGPASTQLALYCAWRLRGTRRALLGGVCFIAPGLLVILVLAALFLAANTPLVIRGAAAGAGAAVAAVALQAAVAVGAASRRRGGAARRGFVGCRCGPGRATDSSLTRAASADRDTTWKGRIPAGKRRRGQVPSPERGGLKPFVRLPRLDDARADDRRRRIDDGHGQDRRAARPQLHALEG